MGWGIVYPPYSVINMGAAQPPVPTTRWVYNFNGVDQYIETGQYIVDVDNLNGVSMEGYFEGGDGTFYSQNVSTLSAGREFQIYELSGILYAIIGGETSTISNALSNGIYKFEFLNGNINTYFNGVLQASVVYTVGGAREPLATFKINARGGGFYKAGKSYNHKINDGSVYSYSINDRTFGPGAVIKNIGTGPDATGINLLESGWQEIPL